MTDHAYDALTHAQQRAGHLFNAISLLRAALKLAPADHPIRPDAEATLAQWEEQWRQETAKIARLQETRE